MSSLKLVGSSGSCFVRVIWVRPALKIIRVWPGLDHVWCNTWYRGEAIPTYVFYEPCPLCVITLCYLRVHETHTPRFACECTYKSLHKSPLTGLHRATPINQLPLQATRRATLALRISCGNAFVQSTCIRPGQSHFQLFEARPGAGKHVGSSTSTCPSLYLPLYKATYLQ